MQAFFSGDFIKNNCECARDVAFLVLWTNIAMIDLFVPRMLLALLTFVIAISKSAKRHTKCSIHERHARMSKCLNFDLPALPFLALFDF